MSSEFSEVQILTIIIIIKYNNELEETLNDFYQTEQEEDYFNIMPLILLYYNIIKWKLMNLSI